MVAGGGPTNCKVEISAQVKVGLSHCGESTLESENNNRLATGAIFTYMRPHERDRFVTGGLPGMAVVHKTASHSVNGADGPLHRVCDQGEHFCPIPYLGAFDRERLSCGRVNQMKHFLCRAVAKEINSAPFLFR
jgi:hypothetical protein